MTVSLPQQLETGIEGIDNQHRALLVWARTVNSMDADNGSREVVLRAAQFLIAYTRYHFDSEEYAMVASGFEGVAQHRREHAMMRRELSKLNASINDHGATAVGSVSSLQELISGWVKYHISSTDFAFARYCESEPSARSVHLPSPKELRASGTRVADYDQVETVHHAGELTVGEMKARLKIRE
jgi:hemerythrin